MKKVYEDGAPTMNIGIGGIAGAPPDSPPVHPRHQPKKNRSVPNPIIADMLRRKVMEEEKKPKPVNLTPKQQQDKTIPSSVASYAEKIYRARMKQLRAPRTDYSKNVNEETFAGASVFEVSSHTFHNAKMEKRKGKHWRTYLDECDELSEIRQYANKNPGKPIVLQNRNTNEMVYVRYGKGR